eukprot:11097690-Alexandrium_andersonii.AAC.1
MTGSKPTTQRKGLMGPPSPMPVASRRRRERPSGAANSAQRGAMKARTSLRQRSGICRRSIISSSQAGASLSKTLL